MTLIQMPMRQKPPATVTDQVITGRAIEVKGLFRSELSKAAAMRELEATRNIVLRARVGTLAADAAQLAETPGDILLLDVNLEDAKEIRALETIVEGEGETPVLVTAPSPSVEVVRQLMRVGIRDVIPQPLTRNELVQAIEGVAKRVQRISGPRKTGTVLCLLKSGGGVGATTIATQGACARAIALGRKRKRRGSEEPSLVCAVDLDIQFGSVALQLDLEVSTNVMDLIEKGSRLEGAMLRSSVTRHRSGLDILPAPGHVHPLESVTPKSAAHLIDIARQEYGEVIVDMPSAWTTWTRAVLAQASAIVMVIRPTVPSIRQARRQIETLVEEQLAHVPLVVIANQVERGWFSRGISLKEMQRALDHPVAQSIGTNTEAMLEAGDAGLMLNEVRGGRQSWREIETLISRTMEMAHAADQPIAALGG